MKPIIKKTKKTIYIVSCESPKINLQPYFFEISFKSLSKANDFIKSIKLITHFTFITLIEFITYNKWTFLNSKEKYPQNITISNHKNELKKYKLINTSNPYKSNSYIQTLGEK